METVNLARGTRDFLPDEAAARHAVVDLLRAVFARHGFESLETPAFERIETLTGKYGDEGAKLIFRILKRGEGAATGEADLALRYDLTVPLARVIAMNTGLRMPFKRWQIAPVWRADRPAKGRYREFTQCDVDVVGTTEPIAEAEVLATAADALETLGFRDYTFRTNDRRVLRAMARACGAADDAAETSLLVTVDKLDKIGRDGVEAELRERGFAPEQTARLWSVLGLQGTNDEILDGLAGVLPGDEVSAAVATLREVIGLAEALGVPVGRVRIDPTVVRGLDYYTGPVFEIAIAGANIGSVGGGGRYDRLIGVFGKQQIPAVGLAFGFERLLVVMQERGMLPARADRPEVLVAVFDADHRAHAARAARAFREAGVRTDLYAGTPKLKNAFKHADVVQARFVALVGPDEAQQGKVVLKELATGQQETLPLADAVGRVVGTRTALQ